MGGSLKQGLGLRVRAARQRVGLTQEELAGRVSRTPESISNIERGLQAPSVETLAELARILDVPIADFFDALGRSESVKSSERLALELSLSELARSLTDRDLAVAVAQVSALLQHRG